MRAAVPLLGALGPCAWVVWLAGCGGGATGPADEEAEPIPSAIPTVAFSSGLGSAPEGGTAVLRLAVSPSSEAPITLGYSIGVDGDPETDDADSADYVGEPRDTVRLGAGDTIGAIELEIRDDDDIEPAREVLTVTLHAPVAGAGFVLGARDTAVVLIEEGVCDRTPRIQDEILRVAGFGHCLEPNHENLAAIVDLELCNREEWPACRRRDAVIPQLRQGDFQGLSQLERLTLAGVGLTDLPEEIFSDLAGLQMLMLENNRLTLLSDRVFSGLSSLQRLSIAGNRLAALPPGVFSDLSNLWWLELSRNPIKELPAGVFGGLLNLSGLVIVNSGLGELPAGMFVGLSKLRSLDLRANPGTPFDLPLQLVRTDNEDLMAPGPAEVAARAEQGTPFPAEVILFIEGAGLLRDTLEIETGHAQSTRITVTGDSASTEGTRITVRSVSEAPEEILGVRFKVADPIVLFASPSGARSPRSAILRATLSIPVRTRRRRFFSRTGAMRRSEWRKQ